ncbi:MAG: DNA adenine methylase [Thermofilaceae archaeon]
MAPVAQLTVKCPVCGGVGALAYRDGGFAVEHGCDAHAVADDVALEVVGGLGRFCFVPYAGGDFYLLPILRRMIPPHLVYVEVFAGSAKLLLSKPPSRIEVYNDLDRGIYTLFKVVKTRYEDFMRALDLLPYSRLLHYEFLEKLERGVEDEVELAVAVYYTLHSSAFGTCGGFAASPTRNKARRFYRAMENIRLVHERLKNVVVECLDFRECIRKYDTPHTFFYLDPPHIPSSLNGYYRVRFTERDLDDLLRILEGVKGKFLLKQSGAVDRVAEWAREHGYKTRTLTLKRSMEGVERGEGKGYWTILFAANYRI